MSGDYVLTRPVGKSGIRSFAVECTYLLECITEGPFILEDISLDACCRVHQEA